MAQRYRSTFSFQHNLWLRTITPCPPLSALPREVAAAGPCHSGTGVNANRALGARTRHGSDHRNSALSRAGECLCPIQPRFHVRDRRGRAGDPKAVRWFRLAADQGARRCPIQPRPHVCLGEGVLETLPRPSDGSGSLLSGCRRLLIQRRMYANGGGCRITCSAMPG